MTKGKIFEGIEDIRRILDDPATEIVGINWSLFEGRAEILFRPRDQDQRRQKLKIEIEHLTNRLYAAKKELMELEASRAISGDSPA